MSITIKATFNLFALKRVCIFYIQSEAVFVMEYFKDAKNKT